MAITDAEAAAVFGMGKVCQAVTGLVASIDAHIADPNDARNESDTADAGEFVTSLRKCRDDLEAAAYGVQAAAVGRVEAPKFR
ncbi:Uncharacterised protein [Mycobacteroides abscessus subsp. abscessus]|uniref:hypothetical protein n=1 Tax=Mycobacteroides abscessus TaxID=36809 RepID=UPI0009A8B921|nr:hypothetical protein [Mycobacteroides abscessus]SLI19685.1 Uncharacterised protein [Mycobacteroides abscessus subsp. abscessus]